MPDEEKHEAKNETPDANNPPLPPNGQTDDALSKKEDTKEQQNTSQKIIIEPPIKPIPINIHEDYRKDKEDREAVIANKISIGNLVLSVFVFGITALLFNETRKTTKAAIDSANAAVDAVKESRKANNLSERNYKLAEDEYKSSIESGKDAARQAEQNFKLQNKSVDAQIKSLNEAQKEFIISNEPFLQFDSIIPQGIIPGRPFEIVAYVSNLGKYPTQLLYFRVMSSIRVNRPDINKILKNDSSNLPLHTLASGKPDRNVFPYPDPVQRWQVEGLITGRYFLYVTGAIRYQNIITGRPKQYNFQYKFDLSNGEYDIPINENVQINDKRIK